MIEKQERGGLVNGPSHDDIGGGPKFRLQDTNTIIEEEGFEANIPIEILHLSGKFKFTGKNFWVINEILKLGKQSPLAQELTLASKVTTVRAGDVVICKLSLWDDTEYTYEGSILEIVSAINESGGCKHVESGAKVTNEETGETKIMKEGGEAPIQLEINSEGGYDYTGESKKIAKRCGLITLPVNIPGTNCGNCLFFKSNFCDHEKLLVPVTKRMCCALWTEKSLLEAIANVLDANFFADKNKSNAILNEKGGFDYSSKELERAKEADLITLPPDIVGTSCAEKNCLYGINNMCVHPKILLPITDRMSCGWWDNEKVERLWGKATEIEFARQGGKISGKQQMRDWQAENPNSPRWKKKKENILKLSNGIQKVRLNISRDLNSEDERDFLTALVISIMDKSGERVGNNASADNGHFGVTGFTKDHVKVVGNKILLDYKGKTGVPHEKDFSDERIAKALKKAIKNSPKTINGKSNKYIFVTSKGIHTSGKQVNDYLEKFGITSKSLRGYFANKNIIKLLNKEDVLLKKENEQKGFTPERLNKERKKIFNKILKKTAKLVGHGAPTLRKHYMIPELPIEYIEKGNIIDLKTFGYYKQGGEVNRLGNAGKLGDISVDKYFLNKNEVPEAVNKKADELYAQAENHENGIEGVFKDCPVGEIDFKDIVPTQDFLRSEKLERVGKVGDIYSIGLPHFIEHDGKYYLMDGHHRTVEMNLKQIPIKGHTCTTKSNTNPMKNEQVEKEGGDIKSGSSAKQISREKAEELFNEGIVVYVKTNSTGEVDTSENAFSLRKDLKGGGALNIYLQGQTQGEYGFDNILKWIKERTEHPDFKLEFYTLNSKNLWYLENGKTLKTGGEVSGSKEIYYTLPQASPVHAKDTKIIIEKDGEPKHTGHGSYQLWKIYMESPAEEQYWIQTGLSHEKARKRAEDMRDNILAGYKVAELSSKLNHGGRSESTSNINHKQLIPMKKDIHSEAHKQRLGSKYIGGGVSVTDKETDKKYKISKMDEGGITLEENNSFKNAHKGVVEVPYEEFEDRFSEGKIDIGGYEHTAPDGIILHQVLQEIIAYHQMGNMSNTINELTTEESEFKSGGIIGKLKANKNGTVNEIQNQYGKIISEVQVENKTYKRNKENKTYSTENGDVLNMEDRTKIKLLKKGGPVQDEMKEGGKTKKSKKEIEETAKYLINNEIYANQDALVRKLLADEILSYDDIENSDHYRVDNKMDGGVEQYMNYNELEEYKERVKNKIDHERMAANKGKWQEHLEELENLESTPQEIYEWWLVSDHLAENLSEQGEPILKSDYGTWWGRTASGQQIIVDGTIQKIVEKLGNYKYGGKTMKSGGETGYQGWKNYETWNVKLWMDNDSSSYEYWEERTDDIIKNSKKDKYLSKKDNAIYTLSEELKEYHQDNNPLSDQASVYTDLLGSALSNVDWREIAENLLSEKMKWKGGEMESGGEMKEGGEAGKGKQKTITVYSFEELSKEAKAKALDKLRDINVTDDWSYVITDEEGGWKDKLEKMGWGDVEIGFSGFYSQGDGASFITKKADIEKLMKHFKFDKKYPLVYADADNVSAEVSRSGRYYHERSTSLNITGYAPDGVDAKEYDKELSALENDLENLMISTNREIYKELEKYNEEITSDEAVKDTIEANEYEFDENGSISRYKQGGKVGYKKFKEGVEIKTTVKMTKEDVGDNIPVGTTGIIETEPKDSEQLVGVMIKGSLHYLPQDVLEVVSKSSNGSMKTGGKTSDKFKEISDMGDQKFLVRDFGHAEIDDKKIPLVLVLDIHDLIKSGAISEDDLQDKDLPVHVYAHIIPDLKNIAQKHKDAAEESGSGEGYEGIANYMGGVPLNSEDLEYQFPTIKDAEKYWKSKEVEKSLDANTIKIGFLLDRNINRAGSTGWDFLEFAIGKKERYFKQGGKLKTEGKANLRKNYYHFEQSAVKNATECATPEWGQKVAGSIKKGAEIRTCRKGDKWFIKSILIPKQGVKASEARKYAEQITSKFHTKKKALGGAAETCTCAEIEKTIRGLETLRDTTSNAEEKAQYQKLINELN